MDISNLPANTVVQVHGNGYIRFIKDDDNMWRAIDDVYSCDEFIDDADLNTYPYRILSAPFGHSYTPRIEKTLVEVDDLEEFPKTAFHLTEYIHCPHDKQFCQLCYNIWKRASA